MTVVVRRSAIKMWLIALASIPFLVIGIDVVTNRRLSDGLREILFTPEDTQIFEARDVIWAWVMLTVAGLLILWGLKELFFPTKVLECRDGGLAVKLRGPFRKHDVIPWEQIEDVGPGEIDDEGDRLSLFNVKVFSRNGLPDHPWGARWVESGTLGLLAEDWSDETEIVAREVENYAVEAARRHRREETSRIWEEP